MNVVGKVSSFITQGVYSVATPFHPFGGAVDIVTVQQQDSSFRSTPWYVRFGKFQGVLKGAEKVVKIEVNGVEANFHMYLDNSGEAYFIREIENQLNVGPEEENNRDDECLTLDTETDSSRLYEFNDDEVSSVESSEYSSGAYDNLDNVGPTNHVLESQASSEVILVSVDGHVLTAPITLAEKLSEKNNENVQLSMPQFNLGPGETSFGTSEASWPDDYLSDVADIDDVACIDEGVGPDDEVAEIEKKVDGFVKKDVFKSCLELTELNTNHREINSSPENSPENQSPEKLCSENSVTSPENQEIVENKESLESPKLANELENSIVSPENSVVLPENSIDSPENSPEKEQIVPELIQNGPKEAISEIEGSRVENLESQGINSGEYVPDSNSSIEISLCKNLLRPGMGSKAASETFETHKIPKEKFKLLISTITKNENLVVRIKGKYFPYEKAAPLILGYVTYGLDLTDLTVSNDEILIENVPEGSRTTSPRKWRLWSIPFRRVKTLEHTSSNLSTEEVFVDTEVDSVSQLEETSQVSSGEFTHKQIVRTNLPTSEQIASLNLKDGQNMVTFIFSTRVLGVQKVDAHIYLWKWNARIVISDVDGTITKSDVLGQVMPLMGKDWTHSGIARLFSAIKENGYQLLFLSARAIVQAYLTKSFLFNLKQDGKNLPTGPVVISPDGLFPSLYREVIRRAPHEFKIACLEDIKALFPPDHNPFYAGFGNRDTDELSYRKIGIPKGKIFIINPKGEVAINNRIDVKSYTSLHTLVNDMFPPTSLIEQLVQEDYNSWNFWKMPIPDIDDL